jgi:hypothetical protein
MSNQTCIWVFVGEKSNSPGGVFSDFKLAEEWIRQHSLSGMLSAYPLDEGVFNWAVRTGRVKQNFADKASPGTIGSFCSHLDHYHYENGRLAV